MSSRTTTVQQLRMAINSTQLQVIKQLGWSEQQFAAFQWQQGQAYLHHEFGRQCPMLPSLMQMKEYWSWWRLHWVSRDQDFLDLSSLLFPHEKEAYYRELHQPDSVPFQPHKALLDNAYHHMIHSMVKTATARK